MELINKLKEWRGFATRYDQLAVTYLVGVSAAIIPVLAAMSHQTRPSRLVLTGLSCS